MAALILDCAVQRRCNRFVLVTSTLAGDRGHRPQVCDVEYCRAPARRVAVQFGHTGERGTEPEAEPNERAGFLVSMGAAF